MLDYQRVCQMTRGSADVDVPEKTSWQGVTESARKARRCCVRLPFRVYGRVISNSQYVTADYSFIALQDHYWI